MPVIEYAPARSRGVTTLMAVGQDESISSTPPLFTTGIKTGLMAMGLATLFGVQPRTARWIGVVGLGLGIALSRR